MHTGLDLLVHAPATDVISDPVIGSQGVLVPALVLRETLN
jgi:hypothetical protein